MDSDGAAAPPEDAPDGDCGAVDDDANGFAEPADPDGADAAALLEEAAADDACLASISVCFYSTLLCPARSSTQLTDDDTGSEVGAGIAPANCDVYELSMHSWPICCTASDSSWTCSDVMPCGTPSIVVQFMQMLNCSNTAPWHAVARASAAASAANTLLYVSHGLAQTSGMASTGKGARVRRVLGVAAAAGEC